MKTRFIIIAGLVSVMLVFAGCRKKDKPPRKFPPQQWEVDQTGAYPYSMTAVVKIPEEIKGTIGVRDQVGAFANGECRGLGQLVNVNGGTVFYVLVSGAASEQIKISFRFYDQAAAYLYETKTPVDYVVDGNFGTADQPARLDLKLVE